ncbi:MAG: PHP domain-containing protein [Vicinamibacterales bacterium]
MSRSHHPPALRADLHVHSCHSRQSGSLKFLKSRDCYSRPEDVYRAARARGMELVTLTDHDSIEGCLEFLDGHPDVDDFFISEEVTCRLPGADLEVHLGVYGMTEALHDAVQPLRDSVRDVAAALREAGVFFSLNHLFHFYRGQIPVVEYLRLLDDVPALETRNGTMVAAHNELATLIAERWKSPQRLGAVGGSDAHTLRRVGLTWTSAPGRTPAEFLASLAGGRGEVGGAHGGALSVAADAYGVIGSYVASLAGFGPRDHSVAHRLACLLFTAVSAPAQFLPVVIAAAGKGAEAREVRRISEELAAALEIGSGRSSAAEART